jgi:hypothetical protein
MRESHNTVNPNAFIITAKIKLHTNGMSINPVTDTTATTYDKLMIKLCEVSQQPF